MQLIEGSKLSESRGLVGCYGEVGKGDHNED